MSNSYSATSARALAFCEEYQRDLNGSKAAVRAGYSSKRAPQAASELLRKPGIQARLAELAKQRSERTAITADMVLVELWAIATADPRELIEYRRTCCRHCWGTDHHHQRTAREVVLARATWETRGTKKRTDVFDLMGGEGYDARRDPNAQCPECFGAGREDVFVHDTRSLSVTASRLYAGVKSTKEGIEVKMHDQHAALVSVGRHLGMFKDVVDHRDLTLEDLIRAAAGGTGDAGDAPR